MCSAESWLQVARAAREQLQIYQTQQRPASSATSPAAEGAWTPQQWWEGFNYLVGWVGGALLVGQASLR